MHWQIGGSVYAYENEKFQKLKQADSKQKAIE